MSVDATAPSPAISEVERLVSDAALKAALSAMDEFQFLDYDDCWTDDAIRVGIAAALPHLVQAAPPPPDGLDDLQREIGQWGESTFQHTDRGIVAHFAEEAQELVDELNALAPGERRHPHLAPIAEEAADCLILLLNLAHYQGWSLRQALLDKHARNQKRTWGEPDANGITHHAGRDATRPAPASPAPAAPTETLDRVLAEIEASDSLWVVTDLGLSHKRPLRWRAEAANPIPIERPRIGGEGDTPLAAAIALRDAIAAAQQPQEGAGLGDED